MIHDTWLREVARAAEWIRTERPRRQGDVELQRAQIDRISLSALSPICFTWASFSIAHESTLRSHYHTLTVLQTADFLFACWGAPLT